MEVATSLSLVSSSAAVLRDIAAPVTDFDSQVRPHLAGMRELMKAKRGLGLAAPQVGISLRFFITSFGRFRVVVNPRIIGRTGSLISKPEGCLTWPGRTAFVARRNMILAEWDGPNGKLTAQFAGLEARCFQHETDPLDGICIF